MCRDEGRDCWSNCAGNAQPCELITASQRLRAVLQLLQYRSNALAADRQTNCCRTLALQKENEGETVVLHGEGPAAAIIGLESDAALRAVSATWGEAHVGHRLPVHVRSEIDVCHR